LFLTLFIVAGGFLSARRPGGVVARPAPSD
jgi:hypothetical protein